MKFFSKKSKGFTLIELLVVISIIGLLSSIVLVALGPARAKARDAKRASDLKQISTAMEMCLGDSNCGTFITYMTSTESVVGYGELSNLDKDSEPCFLCPLPKDPASLNDLDEYNYRWINNVESPREYCVYVKLEAPANTTYFCASEKGVAQKTYEGPPSMDDCCGI